MRIDGKFIGRQYLPIRAAGEGDLESLGQAVGRCSRMTFMRQFYIDTPLAFPYTSRAKKRMLIKQIH